MNAVTEAPHTRIADAVHGALAQPPAAPPPAPEAPQQAARRLSAHKIQQGYRPQALHEYCDASGHILYWRIRLKHPHPAPGQEPKWVRPMRRNAAGQYEIAEPVFPNGKPLYGLDRLAADPAAVVFVVEGERCADELGKLGIVATTSGSSSSADRADWSPLKGRSVIVWPDHDGPGAKYALDAVRHLQAVRCNVRLTDKAIIDALPDKGDVVDWLAQHSDATADTIRALTTVEAPAPQPDVGSDPRAVELIDAAEVKCEPIRWLWPGWLARGKLHVIAGAPGTGKTTIALAWAACVSAAHPFPSGWSPPARGRVLIWSGEDDPADTLVPRLRAAGADLKNIQFVGDVTEEGQRYPFDPARDVDRLAGAVAGINDLALIVIDPLVSAVAADSHKNAEVRRGLQPLVDLAQRMDAALIGVTHYSKGTQGREPLERVTGSLAFGALARLVFGTVKQKADDDTAPSRYLLARVKSNIGPDGGGYAYAFEQTQLPDGIEASRVVFGDAVEGSARELIGSAEADPDDEQGGAANFLRELLADGGMPAKDIYQDAEGAGYSRDQMKRAKAKAGVRVHKDGMTGGWRWYLADPEGGDSIPEGSEGSTHKRLRSSHPSALPSGMVAPNLNGKSGGTDV